MIDDVFVFDVLFDDELEKYSIFYANTPNVLALMTNVANVKLIVVFFQISGREKIITIIEELSHEKSKDSWSSNINKTSWSIRSSFH